MQIITLKRVDSPWDPHINHCLRPVWEVQFLEIFKSDAALINTWDLQNQVCIIGIGGPNPFLSFPTGEL